MNAFWDMLEEVPGLRAHRVDERTGSNMAGWYAAHGHYRPEELGGLSLRRFCEAVRAEGCPCSPGGNFPLHRHPLLQTCDIYGHGKPTRIANAPCDIREAIGSLPVTEGINHRIYTVPWFKHHRPALIAEYARAFRKAAENYRELLEDDPGDGELQGRPGLSARR